MISARVPKIEKHTILCVNKAGYSIPCDWWVAGDAWAIDMQIPMAIYEGIVSVGSPGNRALNPNLKIVDWTSLGIPANAYSTIAAVRFAVECLGSTSIHMIGHDMHGSSYFDGSAIDMDEASRWRSEGEAWASCLHEIKEQGVSIMKWSASGGIQP